MNTLVALAVVASLGQTHTAGPPKEADKLPLLLHDTMMAARNIVNPKDRALVFLLISRSQLRTGDDRGAESLISESLAIAESLKDGATGAEANPILMAVAEMQAQSGDVKSALKTVELCEDGAWRDRCRYLIIGVLSRRGEYSMALDVCESIEQAQLRDANFGQIVSIASSRGDLVSALAVLTRVEGLATRRAELAAVVETEIDAHRFSSAKRILEAIDSPRIRVGLLCRLASAKVDAGDIDGAMALTEEVRCGAAGSHIEIGTKMIMLQAQIGDLPAALAAADALDDVSQRAEIVNRLIVWLAEQGRMADAVRLLPRIQHDRGGDYTLQKLLPLQAKAGDVNGALRGASSLQDPYSRSCVFRELAKVQSANGDGAAARVSCALARDAAEEVPLGAGTDVILLCDIAAVQAEIGDSDDARRTFVQAFSAVEAYSDGYYRSHLARDVARAETMAGLSSDATKWASELASADMRALALIGIVEGILARQPAPKKDET